MADRLEERLYYPKHLSKYDRQVACICMCHEQGPATEHVPGEKCPCKIGGYHGVG